MWTNDKIILLADISAPAAMAGAKGDVKIIDIDIPLYYAKLAVKGGHARQVEDAEIDSVLIELGLKEPEPEPAKKTRKRKEKANVGKRADIRADKESDNSPVTEGAEKGAD